MNRQRKPSIAGFTLIEVTIAVALLALVLTAAAQALVTNYSAMDVLDKKNDALLNCRGILSQMRQLRDTTPGAFPAVITDRWPDGASTSDAVSVFLAADISLPGEVLTVTYVDATANPLDVIITSRWIRVDGGQATTMLSTTLTNYL